MSNGAPIGPAVVVWRSLGPYHVARMRAAAERFSALGMHVVAVELSDSEESRDWQIDREAARFEVRTLMRGELLTAGSRNVTSQLIENLDALNPLAIAIAGYDRPEMRAALRWANQHRRPAILMSETKWDDRPRPWWKRALASRIVRKADAAIVSGSASAEYLVALGMPREMIFRQYGAVDNAFFASRAAAARAGEGGGLPYFLACSRLIERRKNLLRLIDAYAGYRSAAGDKAWELVICGDGEDRARLEHHVRVLRVEGVTFAGFQQGDALAEYYGHAACFVHPATQEAWGLVVNEAMAAGLPVLISRRAGCAQDLVRAGHNGWTFDPGDTADITDKMLAMHDLSNAARAQFGRESQRAILDYGVEHFAGGLVAALRAVRNRTGRGPLLEELANAVSSVSAPGDASALSQCDSPALAANASQPELQRANS